MDDAVLPAESEQTLTDLVEYATELLDLFSYSFKDVNVNNQPLRTSTNTMDGNGKLSIYGYSWWPRDDCFSIKSPRLTSGRKLRGKINPPPNNANF